METQRAEPFRDRALLAVLVVSTAVRLLLAGVFFGFVGGDDVEILEAAFRVATGLGYAPWEIRNLLLPDLIVAPVVALARGLGVTATAHLVLAAKLPFIALASVNVVLVYVLAHRWLGGRTAARLAAVLLAFHWLPLGYGSTTYPRTVSATCVLAGALLLSGQRRDAARGLAAGALLSVALATRYSEVVFSVPLLALAWLGVTDAEARVRRCAGLIGGVIVGTCLTAGLWDLVTWGRPFASLLAFARYILERQSSSPIAERPVWWYLGRLPSWLPVTLLPPLVSAWPRKETRLIRWFLLAPLLLLSLIYHKELRYLQASIPFLAVLGAAGIAAWLDRGWRRAALAVLVLSLAVEASGVRFLARTSMAAVEAARSMALEPGVRVVALSQRWAYGDRLYLGDRVEVRDLPVPPSPKDLAAARGADRVALYLEDLQDNPELELTLARLGFARVGTFHWGWSRPVVLFRPAE